MATRCSLFLVVVGIVVGFWAAPVLAAAPDGQEEICSNPAVFFCDNFEARALGSGDFGRQLYKNNGWAVSTGALQNVQTAERRRRSREG